MFFCDKSRMRKKTKMKTRAAGMKRTTVRTKVMTATQSETSAP
jgi:hypothetical protein